MSSYANEIKRLCVVSALDALRKTWAVYDSDSPEDIGKYGEFATEDISIITTDGEEVVGCSEWMRADREVFEHIVKLHNDSLLRTDL